MDLHFLLAKWSEGWYTEMEFSAWVSAVNGFLWGVPGVCLILGVGLWLTVCLGVPQLRLFPRACREFTRRLSGGGSSSIQALCTALAATVGTGNIAGVAGAIALGGPGAVLWMLLSAFVGMATKFAESTLAVRFREQDATGAFLGGPMYVIRQALSHRWKPLASIYSFLGICAGFGVGNATQVNAVLSAMESTAQQYGMTQSSWVRWVAAAAMATVVVVLVSGGAKKIGQGAELLVPVVSVGYVAVCLGALWLHRERLPQAVEAIFHGAFQSRAVTGGAIGSIFVTLRTGVCRGVFTNEAGMGTAAMAHGCAQVEHPAQQGLMGMMEVFLDTVVICTMTALVILTSGVSIPYGVDSGSELTAQALGASFGPGASAFLCACLSLFALATILGWGLYTGRCIQYLFSSISWKAFAFLQGLGVILGAVLETGTVWSLAETMNGLMAIPNLLVLLRLTPELRRLTKQYTMIHGRSSAAGGNRYENFHQRQPL